MSVEFCGQCGSTKKSEQKAVMRIIRNSLILFVAAIMFAFSFLPVMELSLLNNISYLDADFEISCIDNIVYFFSLLDSYNFESGIAISLCFSAVLSALYLVLTAAFVVLAFFNLLGTFSIGPGGKRIYAWTLALLAAVPPLLIAVFVSMVYTFTSAYNASLGGTAIAGLALTFAVIVFVAVERMIFTKNKNIRVFVMRGVVALLALVVVASTLAPIGISSVDDEFLGVSGRATVKINYGVAATNEFSNITQEKYDLYRRILSNDYNSLYSSITRLNTIEARNVQGRVENNTLVKTLIFRNYTRETVALLGLLPLIYSFTAIAAAVVMWQSLKYLVSGKESKGWYIVSRICLVVFSVLALALTIAFVIMVVFFKARVLPTSYSFTIGAAPILVTVFSVIIMSLPMFKNKKWIDEDENMVYEVAVVKESYIAEQRAEAENEEVSSRPAVKSVVAMFEDLKLLKELLDMGAITQDEFDDKKAQILNI